MLVSAHRQPANLARRRQIALEQHRRHAQRLGDVVEAVAFVVGRQEPGSVNINGGANREWRSRIRRDSIDALEFGRDSASRRRMIERRFKRHGEALHGPPDPAAACLAAAWRPRAPCAPLFSHVSASSETLAGSALSSRQPGSLQLFVMASDAVLIEERSGGGSGGLHAGQGRPSGDHRECPASWHETGSYIRFMWDGRERLPCTINYIPRRERAACSRVYMYVLNLCTSEGLVRHVVVDLHHQRRHRDRLGMLDERSRRNRLEC